MAARPQRIHRKTFARLVAVAVLPVIALGLGAFVALESMSRDSDRQVAETHDQLAGELVGDELARSARALLAELQLYVDERTADAATWASVPTLQAAASDGTALAVALELVRLPPRELEPLFASSRRLPGSPEATNFLVDEVTRSPEVISIAVTNEYGHNVAVSTPTPDIAQGDEDWWRNAWDRGVDIGAIELDESADMLTTAISVRIDGTTSGAPLGVMTVVVDMSVVQDLADRLATSAGTDITILDAAGRLVAETDGGHRSARILVEEVELDATIERLGALPAAEPGRELGASAVYGYASAPLSDSSPAWTVVVEQPNRVAFASLTDIDELGDDLRRSADRFSVTLVLVVVGALAVALLVSFVLARGIGGPRESLRDTPNDAAEHIPHLVDQIQPAHAEEPLDIASIGAATGDEVEELAPAVESGQSTGVGVAAEQVEAKGRNVAQAFVNMGRRDRNLLRRQVAMIERLGNDQDDDHVQPVLSGLAQLSLRLQRNAENLLVLAAEDSLPTDIGSVPISEVLDRSGAVLEEYSRVESALDPVRLVGIVAADAAHLLAELLENALAFSPPDTPVTVEGRLTAAGYRISVTDHGIGIANHELATANERLHRPRLFSRSPETRLGLHVVGCLAARHEMQLELVEAPAGGIVAHITIPLALLEEPTNEDGSGLDSSGSREAADPDSRTITVDRAAVTINLPAREMESRAR